MRYISSTVFVCLMALASSASFANEVWRCPGNVYTNQPTELQKTNGQCTLVKNDVSVVPAPTSTGGSTYSGNNGRDTAIDNPSDNNNGTQTNNRQTRQIQAQINQAVRELNALEDEYKDGTPDRLGPETRNYQKYLDRVERLKGEIAAKKQEIQSLRSQL